ncbi:annexin A1-like [Mastacembelus armatus]|uniref:Annexin n=1 Tax=Mastacembelus armatus TaxID=205130 RepID=A0A3Q3KYH3_9TELE|nr:annexin A1-like [Mastacembelus armatus]XP_026153411.1 annexin A1-like [Mastacembelus armatus]
MSLFKKFLNKIVHDGNSKGDSTAVTIKSKPVYYGTVHPYPNFNASSDASVLKSAIETKGVDEDVITAVLVKRNNEQRQMIKAVFEASHGKKVENALKKALRSHFEDVCLALLMTRAQFDAHWLRKATQRMGTDEDVLVEILATRSNQEIREIKRVFKEEYKEDLEDVIKKETNGDFTMALLSMLKANKDESTVVDASQAKKDAEALFEAGENMKGVNVSTITDILTTRNGPQLCKMFQQYSTVSNNTLPKALEKELRGDIENCLLDIVKCAWNTPAFFAEKLHLAMKGAGTSEEKLTRVLVSRSEVDLKKILDEYKAMYGISLQEHLVKETSGHYQKALLGLCGAQ